MTGILDNDDSKYGATILEEDEDEEEVEDCVGRNGEPMIRTHLNEDGTTSSYFDKRKLKIAPRSTLQFKVGPPFEFLGNYHTITEINTSKSIQFQIIPRIDRGFDYIDNEWVGYKRNYFTLVSSFETPGWDLQHYLKSTFQLNMTFGNITKSCKIKYFAIKIKARSDEDYSEISLVQHTAKRDKGPQFIPATCPLIPSALPKHQIIREASNVRNTNKMKKYDSTFYFHRDQEDLSNFTSESLLRTYPNDSIQKVARYERVQFASSINVKKPTQQNRHFRLHVILGAVINVKDGFPDISGDSTSGLPISEEVMLLDGTKDGFVPLQEMRTPPLIIRGRSPSNYTSSQQRVSIRGKSSSINSLEKRELSGCPIVDSSPMSQSSPEETTVSSSPIKSKACRTSRRKSKVIGIASSINMKNENDNVIVRRNNRVETLEQIEKTLHETVPLNSLSPNDENKLGLEYNSLERRILSRHNSIDPREIELKPSPIMRNAFFANDFDQENDDENHFTTGSLALTATLKSQNINVLKRRRLSQHEAAVKIIPDTLSNKRSATSPKSPINPQNSNSKKPNRKTPPPSRQESRYEDYNNYEESFINDLNSISLSILEDSSSNYYHVTNIESNNSEVDVMPRTFTRLTGENSFTNLYLQMETATQTEESFLTRKTEEKIISTVCTLPSQMMNVEELYEELGFYKQ